MYGMCLVCRGGQSVRLCIRVYLSSDKLAALPDMEKYFHQGNKEKPELVKVKTSAGHGK
jgi:hypothetical protein